MPVLVIVRHGQSQFNLENRFTGDLDVELSPLGEAEATHAGKILKDIQFDKAFTSVLKRAIRTLDLILKENDHSDIPVIKNAALNERRYGDLQGLNKSDTEKKYGVEQVRLWRRTFEAVPPGGESLKETRDRTVPFYLSDIEPELRKQENVLIVAHGNSLRALMMYLENLTVDQISTVDLATGTPRKYQFDSAMKLTEVGYLL